MTDMTGNVCMVTGANAGIGKATALGLAERGAITVMVARNKERGEAAQAEIIEQSGNEAVHLLLADLSEMAQVRQLAADFKAQFDRLDVLINNAAIIPQERRETPDGFELQLAVNHLAPFLLTNLLLDVLKESAPARVITVSSMAHQGARIDFDDLHSERGYSHTKVYGRTKLMNILFTKELARRLEGTGVTANCLHPGVIDTNLLADFMGRPRSGGSGRSAAEGAKTSLYLATSEEVEGVSGKYFNNERLAKPSEAANNEATAKKLWQVSAELVGLD